jgi:DNA-binding XRE family transcriptional regulator
MAKITRTDLARVDILQKEALRAINLGKYDLALELAQAIDQVFYKKGICLLEATEWDLNLDNIYKKHHGLEIEWYSQVRPWSIEAIDFCKGR